MAYSPPRSRSRPYRPWFMFPLGIIALLIAMACCTGCCAAAPPRCYTACPQMEPLPPVCHVHPPCSVSPQRYSEPQMPYVDVDGRMTLMPKSAYGPWIRVEPTTQ